MDYKNIITAIDRCDDIKDVKYIINSINENQINSKQWLLDNSRNYFDVLPENPKVLIAAGWFGLLGNMIYNEKVSEQIVVVDVDPICKKYGKKLYPHLKHLTEDISNLYDSYIQSFDFITCTACEHISDDKLNVFLKKKNKSSIVVLQSNDYYGVDGHINCKDSLTNFKKSVHLNILESYELKTEKYTRFMIVGY